MFAGMLGPREAIALFVVLSRRPRWSGRSVARRVGGHLTAPERCLFVGPTDEALRFREKLEHDHATNAKLVAQIELDNASPWASAAVATAPSPMPASSSSSSESSA